MKRNSVLLLILASCLAATFAFAAKDKTTATFTALSNSGITGELTLSSMPNGKTMIKGRIEGLQENTEYVSLFYEGTSCALEVDSQNDVVARFRGNKGGVAHFNVKIDEELDSIHSISVRSGSDINQLLACATVSP